MTNANELNSFDCGIEEINQMIHSQLQNLLHKDNKTFIVRYIFSKQIIAVYTIGCRDILLELETKNDIATTTKLSAMELSLLAVNHSYRNNGIGSYILNKVKHLARKEKYSILYIEAYHNTKYSTVNFYSRQGFETHSYNYNTTSMYIFTS